MVRKILKLILVLSICLLIGGALVSCTELLQGGTLEGGKSVESIVFSEDGTKLVITYTNGEVEEMDAPSFACDCTDVTTVVVEEHSYDPIEGEIAGKYIDLCSKCNKFEIVTEVRHSFGEEVTVAPTCTKEGYTGATCTLCGYYKAVEGSIVPALGHKNDSYTIFIGEGDTLCEDGGYQVYVCDRECDGTVCGEVSRIRIDPTGHTVPVWEYDLAPTALSTGSIKGECINCYEYQHKILPALNLDDYDVTEGEDTSCTETRVGYYTYNGSERDEYGNPFKYEGTIPAKGHSAGGVSFDQLETKLTSSGVAYVYGQAGIVLLDGAAPICGEVSDGYYKCDDCQESISIKIYGDHKWSDVIIGATCTSGAIRTCELCGGTEEVGDKLAHNYDYLLACTNSTALTFKLVSKCTVCSTQNSGVSLNVGDVAVDLANSYEPQCAQNGRTRYVYTFIADGETHSVYCDVVIPMTNVHGLVVDGVTVAPNASGHYSSEYIGKGLFVLVQDGQPLPDQVTCGLTYKGYARCSCGISFSVTIYNPHNLVLDTTHREYKAPTCTSTGVDVFLCNKEGCRYYETRISDPINHEFDYELEEYTEGAATLYRVVGYCACATIDIAAQRLTDNDVDITVVNSTCQVKGSKTVVANVTAGGKVISLSLTKELPLTGHYVAEGIELATLPKADNGAYIYDSAYFTPLNTPDFVCGEGNVFQGYYKCAVCNAHYSVTLTADHIWGKYTQIKAPTATEAGKETATCQNCGETHERDIPPVGQ